MLQPTSSEKRELFGIKKGLKYGFNQLKFFYSRYFRPTSWILLKHLFLSPSWPLSQQPIRTSASWVIDSEPIRARGIIVKDIYLFETLHIFKFLFSRIKSTLSLAPTDLILSMFLTHTKSGQPEFHLITLSRYYSLSNV